MMKLLFKQRFFSWLDSYDIFDEMGNAVFQVEGRISWGHCLEIYNMAGLHLGTVKEEVLTFLPRFRIYVADQLMGEIRKEFTFFRPKFTLDFNGWTVEGDFWQWDYEVMNGSETIMRASKRLWNFTDTYEIDVVKPENVLYSLMIVLAIDAAKCSSGND